MELERENDRMIERTTERGEDNETRLSASTSHPSTEQIEDEEEEV